MAKKKYYETDEFKALHSQWNDKLEAAGFEGELESLEEECIVKPQVFKADKVQSHGGLEYYEFCQQVLREFHWDLNEESKIDDVRYSIFFLHSEGKSNREIAQYLVDNSLRPYDQRHCGRIIAKIKNDFLRMVR